MMEGNLVGRDVARGKRRLEKIRWDTFMRKAVIVSGNEIDK